MADFIAIAKHSLVITGFVFVMMLAVEYINVMTRGAWQRHLTRNRAGQVLLAVFLGALPGCLGAFVVVAMYVHRLMGLGALVAAMIVTSGDEAFVMLSLIPADALLLTGILAVVAFVVGWTLARFFEARPDSDADFGSMPLHDEEVCHCFPRGQILAMWRNCTAVRGLLGTFLIFFAAALLLGEIGPPQWNWIRGSLLFATLFSIFVVATVPDHFLEEHLWQHVARKHLPRIFVWTVMALVLMWAVADLWHLEDMVKGSPWAMLGIASAVGLVPESGPHLMFVTMYSEGYVPFAVLMASSIVQDGHGMLPLLAHSRKVFFLVKGINLLAGLAVGALWLLLA
ncbi:MAG: arsenic efflux protein [Deltaproteobacteria bacterium]|nr:arsenic efflux protein [Deltaproteobacteria bacterium]